MAGRTAKGTLGMDASPPTRIIEIRRSREKLLGLIFIFLPFVAAGVWALTQRAPWSVLLGAGFFSFCFLISWHHLANAEKVIIRITPVGLYDARVLDEVLPWRSITGISYRVAGSHRFMMIEMDLETRKQVVKSPWKKSVVGFNWRLGGLFVSAGLLEMGFDELSDHVQDYWKAYGLSHTAPR